MHPRRKKCILAYFGCFFSFSLISVSPGLGRPTATLQAMFIMKVTPEIRKKIATFCAFFEYLRLSASCQQGVVNFLPLPSCTKLTPFWLPWQRLHNFRILGDFYDFFEIFEILEKHNGF